MKRTIDINRTIPRLVICFVCIGCVIWNSVKTFLITLMPILLDSYELDGIYCAELKIAIANNPSLLLDLPLWATKGICILSMILCTFSIILIRNLIIDFTKEVKSSSK